MDLMKAIGDNVVLVSAILFVILLILYGLFYKKSGSATGSKKSEENKEKEDPNKKNKEALISYIFYFIFGSLAIYALYLIYIKYTSHQLMVSALPQGTSSKSGIVGGGSSNPAHAQKLASALGNYSVKMTGDDIDVGFLE